MGIRRSSAAASVTAGLKWPPEMSPTAKIAASRPNPKPSGTTTRIGAFMTPAARIVIDPTKTRKNVPSNSAKYLEALTGPSTELRAPMGTGAVAGRSNQKRMMVLCDLGRAVPTALIPLSVVFHGPTMAVILIVAAPMSTLRSLFLAAYTAAVPAIAGRPRLAQANSYFEVVYSTGFIIGPAIAGLLATAIGPGLTLGIDAASFVVASIGVALVRRPLRAPGDRPASHLG